MIPKMARSSVRHDFTDTTKKRARSKSVGRSWPGPTGRHLQQGNETAHASARLPIREQRYLSCWSTEFAFAEGHGKNRRVSCGIKARRGWPKKFCLPNHAFNVPRHFRATIGLPNTSHRGHRRWVTGSGAEALVRSFRLH